VNYQVDHGVGRTNEREWGQITSRNGTRTRWETLQGKQYLHSVCPHHSKKQAESTLMTKELTSSSLGLAPLPVLTHRELGLHWIQSLDRGNKEEETIHEWQYTSFGRICRSISECHCHCHCRRRSRRFGHYFGGCQLCSCSHR
jgi:hypothetical protein